MKARFHSLPGWEHAIVIYNAKHFHSVVIEDTEAEALVRALKELGIKAPNCDYCDDLGCDYCNNYPGIAM